MDQFDGHRLRHWRRMKEIKQDHLAELLGVTQASVSRWERGQQIPAPHILRLLQSMMREDRKRSRLDHSLKRLVRDSTASVHIVEDQSHRLLSSSQTRLMEWQRDASDLMGLSLWRFATEEIAAAEAALEDLGWWANEIDCVAFPVKGRNGPPMRVWPQHVLWEKIRLEDGSILRLTTSIDSKDFAALPTEQKFHF